MTSDDISRAVGVQRKLEEILAPSFRVTFQTDVADFLVASGLSYDVSTLYHDATPEVLAAARDRYELRRRRSTVGGKLAQRKLGERLTAGYVRGEYRTIRELRIWLRQELWPRIGEKSMLYLGDILFQEYGIPPFRMLGLLKQYVKVRGPPPY